MIAIWVVLAVALDLVFYFVVGPHVPPGAMTSTASGAQFDFNVLFLIAFPVVLAVWVYWAYALVVWRGSREGAPEPEGGPKARGHFGVQVAWIVITTVIVIGVFIFGTVELIVPAGAGGGEGPSPIWTPTSHDVLPVQVIAQQWEFTYRYPTFGGFESRQLMLPVDTTVAFHVTSLDVIHSFWAYQLGIKADANPSTDNVAYTKTQQLGSVTVRCSELCGLWHGAMYNYGRVVPGRNSSPGRRQLNMRMPPTRNSCRLSPIRMSQTPTAPTAGTTPTTSIRTAQWKRTAPRIRAIRKDD